MAIERIQDRARGRWRDILRAIGLTERQVSGHHAPCPVCVDGGGKDRFRFDDKRGEGTWICNRCGAGTGVDFVMKYRGVDFMGAKAEIERHIGAARFSAPKAQTTTDETAKRAEAGWGWTQALDGRDPASLWLANRGIRPLSYPPSIRWSDQAPYLHEDKKKTLHPSMCAKLMSADAGSFMIHRTFLTEDGFKANVGEARKIAPGAVPEGAAVRLAPAAEVMGVSTGIETSFSAMRMFRLPVWATLNDRLLLKWKPPVICKRVVIFGDNDESFSGQMASYGLAFTLKQKGYEVEVRIPEFQGWDWNDVDMDDQGLAKMKREAGRAHYGNDHAGKVFEHQSDWV